MRTLLLFALAGCTGPEKDPIETAPGDTGSPDTADTADTGDSVPVDTDETDETGDSAPVIIDNDGDGVSPDDGDCNDADATTYPGAADPACDGVDNDCDGAGLDDTFAIGLVRYADLQSALDAAVDGDTVDVCQGAFVANTTFAPDAPMAVTVRAWSGDPADTVLDGGSLGPILVIGPGADVTLENLGFSNGVSSWRDDVWLSSGGAIFADGAMLTVRGSRFETNTATEWGGAIAAGVDDDATSGLVVEDCTFEDNRALANGGAIAVRADSVDASPTVEVTSGTFTNDRASESGGALYFYGDGLRATVASSDFDTNSVSGHRSAGGAIEAAGAGVALTVSDSSFTDNTSGRWAGAVSMTADTSDLVVDTCTFSLNNSSDTGGAVQIQSADMDVEVASSVFDSNAASAQGGGVELDGGGRAAFDTNTLTNNSVGSGGGAFALLEGDGDTLEVAITGGFVQTNRAGPVGGGALYAIGARVDVSGVDMGTGATDNTPYDVYNCAGQDYSTGADFVFDDSAEPYCQ
jgi:predicted outer membrane repeat protein